MQINESELAVVLAGPSGRRVEVDSEDGPRGLVRLRGAASGQSWLDSDALVDGDLRRFPRTRLVRQGAVLAQPLTVAAALAAGYSAIFEGIEEYLCRRTRTFHAIARLTRSPFAINAYLTPAGAVALHWHADDHLVLVLQLEGCKRWMFDHDVRSRSARTLAADEVPAGCDEIVLQPGDGLLVPAGLAHTARAEGSGSSLHLSVALRQPELADLVNLAVREAVDGDVDGDGPEQRADVLSLDGAAFAARVAGVSEWLSVANLVLLREELLVRMICALPPLPVDPALAAGCSRMCLPYSSWMHVSRVPGTRARLALPGLGVTAAGARTLQLDTDGDRLLSALCTGAWDQPGGRRDFRLDEIAAAAGVDCAAAAEICADLGQLGLLDSAWERQAPAP